MPKWSWGPISGSALFLILFLWLPPVFATQELNDVQSRLNHTEVAEVLKPTTIEEIQAAVLRAKQEGRAVSISGGRHAMGGQQFGAGNLHLDMTGMNRVIGLDTKNGIVEAESGVMWPDLIKVLQEKQINSPNPWTIRQKQTGADRLTLGGALSANVHGRGLMMKPFIADVESFELVDAEGRVRTASRAENTELFQAAIGGYGLFGVITRVKLRLMPKMLLERRVKLVKAKDLIAAFDEKISEGYVFGDFQYDIDPRSRDFMLRGIFSCYKPSASSAAVPQEQKKLSVDAWRRLAYLAHHDKKAAFAAYAKHYLATDGQLYWSDAHSISTYDENYHDRSIADSESSEMITELYVPREKLFMFLKNLRKDFRRHAVHAIYGTIRLVERDEESILAWARQDWACVIVNVHVEHTESGLTRARADFRRMIDRALEFGGSFYLTYHRWAGGSQIRSAHPRIDEWLAIQEKLDPEQRFQSEWSRALKKELAA